MSVTAIRGKDWVFNAFWACGELSAKKCTLTIPVTTLFRDGKPFKCLGTDDAGLVRRVDVDEIILERTEKDLGFRGESLKRLRVLRAHLIDFADKNGYIEYQQDCNQEPLICTVRKSAT